MPSLEKLVEIIASLYPLPDSSFRLVEDAGLRREWIAFKDKGIDNWFSILQEAKARGRLTTLIENITVERTDRTDLKDAYSTYLADIAQQPPTMIDKVAIGLEALAKLAKMPEIQHILLTYRNDFEKASRKIDDLGNYKDLHDLLHELQIHCHDPIAQIAERPRSNADAWKDLKAHLTTLRRIRIVLQTLSRRTTFNQTEMHGIENSLTEAETLLEQAILKKSSKKTITAIALIDRVLDIYPPIVNVRLNYTARELRMTELSTSMTIVRDKIAELHSESPEVEEFVAGVHDLVKLSEALTAQIHVHDTWQVIDRDLRQVEHDLSRDLNMLKCCWELMKKNAALLYQNSKEALASEFKTAGSNLDKAVKGGNTKAIRDSFREYRRQAIELFYIVDIKLKDFCGDLRTIGGAPLSAVTNALDAATR